MAFIADVIPPLNTAIVAVVGVLLIVGWRLIKANRVEAHKRTMLTATALFSGFLILYATRLIVEGPTSFTTHNPDAPAWAAPFYFVFLGTHMLLAIITVVLIPIAIRFGVTKQVERHRRVARKLLPLWLVSIAMGISVYFMLFQIWAP